jgi:hypothetical protein
MSAKEEISFYLEYQCYYILQRKYDLFSLHLILQQYLFLSSYLNFCWQVEKEKCINGNFLITIEFNENIIVYSIRIYSLSIKAH